MRKALAMICIIFTVFLLFAGCSGERNAQGQTAAGADVPWLKSLEIYSNAANPGYLYHAAYPYGYYAFTTDRDGNRVTKRFDLTDHIRTEELAQEEEGFQYFIDYVEELPEKQEGNELSYYIICRYIDKEGTEQNVYRRGYDAFPEGWDSFIEEYNRICGGEYLFAGDKIQTVTPAFLTEAFGVTDADVREGTLQDVIHIQKLDMLKVTDAFQIKDALAGYYASIKEPLLEPHRPGELTPIESTQEEYDAFLNSFFAKLDGCRVEALESDQEHLRYFYLPDTGQHFYTAKTSDLEQLPTQKRTGDDYYCLELDAHMEGMSMVVEFLYNADGRFLLVPMDCGTDVTIAFCE